MLRQLCNVFVNHVETSTPVVGNIRGSIPSWLRGNFLFTASGLIDLPSPNTIPSSPGSVPETHFTVNHYGDGYALLGNFHIKNPNHVTFQTKFLESSAYTKALAAGRTVLPEYGTPSTPEVGEKKKSKGGIFALLSGKTPETSDNGNHAMYRSGSNFYTTNGQAYFTQFNPADLQTGPKSECKKMFGLSSMGAHPLTDQEGTLWNVGAKVGAGGATTNFIKIKTLPDQEPKETAEKPEFEILGAIPSVSSGNISSIHTFGMTSNYLVFVDSPTTVNLKKYIQTTVTGADYALLDLVEWLPEHRNRFHIVDKSSGTLLSSQKIIQSTDPFFYTHLTNCYVEDHSDGNNEAAGPQLVIDIHTFPNMSATLGLTVENLRNDAPICTPEEEGALQRFRVPLNTLTSTDSVDLTPKTLTGQGISSVTLNRNYIGKPYRYCYGHGSYTRGPYANSVVKFDLENGSELKWNGGEHAYLTEVTFVENPNGGGGAKEDDGVLIGGVCDLRKNEPDYLIILKAEDMTEIARVEFDNPIPVYVHGFFVPESST